MVEIKTRDMSNLPPQEILVDANVRGTPIVKHGVLQGPEGRSVCEYSVGLFAFDVARPCRIGKTFTRIWCLEMFEPSPVTISRKF